MFNCVHVTHYICDQTFTNTFSVLVNDAKYGHMSHFIFKLTLVESACVESLDKTISHISLSDRRGRERSMTELKVIETCLC